jgi:hypothetical protein
MDACARRKVDGICQLRGALQDFRDRSGAVLPHHRVHGRAREIRIDDVRDLPFGPERKRTGEAGVIKLRLAELSKRVEQIGQIAELAPFLGQFERADDDARVRRWIVAKIDGTETTRTEFGTNAKRNETVRPMLG